MELTRRIAGIWAADFGDLKKNCNRRLHEVRRFLRFRPKPPIWRLDSCGDSGDYPRKCPRIISGISNNLRLRTTLRMRMRRTDEDEYEDEEDWPGAGGRLQAPTRGQLTVGVAAAVAGLHDPRPHGLPKCRSVPGGQVRAFWANT